jgi:cell wall-associated NlpC family hydrolase
MDRRATATKLAWHFVGTPYVWGGDDPTGFDCSGLCIEILKSVGLLPRVGDWTAAGLYAKFEPRSVLNGDEGVLVFYQTRSGKIIHVEYCIDKELSIGASGGGSATLNPALAAEHNAYVKVRPFRSRDNISGFLDPFL